MGIVLRKSFKGTHVWIPPIPEQKACSSGIDINNHKQNMVKIDAMFFSATEETMVLQGEKDHESQKYLEHDTMILCNPNAMAYQNMINYPHAYYLKFFRNK